MKKIILIFVMLLHFIILFTSCSISKRTMTNVKIQEPDIEYVLQE